MNLKEIKDLIKFVSNAGVSEVSIENEEGFKLNIVKNSEANTVQGTYAVSAPANPVAVDPVSVVASEPSVPKKESSADDTSNYIEIKSPMIGTFYRKPSPDKDVFVSVGDTISGDSVVCIIEAMKLFNEVEAEISGTIVKCLVEDNSPVEFDQPLFLVEPN